MSGFLADTTKYVNKSAKAILDAINRDDYNEKDLSRDLGIFEKYYGQENLGYLQDMLDKSQGPKANKGVEVLEDGKFNVKMDRLNSIIDKYYAGEQLSAAENEEIKLYDLRSNDKIDIQPEENNKTDLLVDNKSYQNLPKNLKCDFFSLDINFICLPLNYVGKLEYIINKYQISLNRYL